MGLNTSTLCFRRIDFAVYKRCERRTTMGKNCQQISLQRLSSYKNNLMQYIIICTYKKSKNAFSSCHAKYVWLVYGA